MRIQNIHKRDYKLPTSVIAEKLDSLSSAEDRLWPVEQWMPMVLDNGLQAESEGGHGPIGYVVEQYEYGKRVVFRFTSPTEFRGVHRFDIVELTSEKTRLIHTIEMQVNLKGLLTWYIVVKWLHDALLEDCLDKVYNQHHDSSITSPHGLWVKALRLLLKSE